MLIVIYIVSQLASTYYMSTSMEKSQRIMLMFLPVVFITFLLRFPIGLVLYWVTTNLWTVGQGLITRRLVAKTPPQSKTGPKRTSRAAPQERNDGDAPKQEAPAQKEEPAAPTGPRRVKRKKRARR